MTEELTETIRLAMQRLFGPLLAIAVLAWLCIRLEALGVFAAIRSAVRKMSAFQRFAAAASLAVLIAFAGDKTNSPPMNMPNVEWRMENGELSQLPLSGAPSILHSPFSILNSSIGQAEPFARPTDGVVTQETWRLRGAHEDHARIPSVPGWSMLTPSGRVDSLDVLASGGFGVSPCDSFYPPPFADGLSLAPAANWNALAGEDRVSLFWHAVTPSNSLIATWQDALLGRSATNIVSFQAEFQPGGGFEYRYGDRCVSYSSVPPFDLDGDGLENSVDPDPLVSGPDAHGTNAEWYNTVCSNVLAAVEGQSGVELSWLEGVNSNAYFFAEVVADIGPAAVYFTGDAEESRLGDPVVVALAGETNRVPLLVGVGYSVSSDVPLSVSVPDGVVVTLNGLHSYMVERPVSFEFVPDVEAFATGVVAYAVQVDPAGLEGTFAWESTGQPLPNGELRMENGELAQPASPGAASVLHSPFSILHSSLGTTSILHSSFSILNSSTGCSFLGIGNYVIFTCGEGCGCGGCEAVGSYSYENICVPMSGGACGCTPENNNEPEDPEYPPSGGEPPDPPPVPSVSASFSTSAVIFEDRYENSPGSWVEKRSNQTTLTVSADGGEHGGMLYITCQNLDKLAVAGGGQSTLPSSVSVGAFEHVEYTYTYEAVSASSGVGDIKVTASFSEFMTGIALDPSVAELTAVEIGVVAQKNKPLPVSRHRFGVCEVVKAGWKPSSVSVSWTSSGSGSWMRSLSVFLEYQCPAQAENFLLTASYNGATLDIPLTCVAPSQIIAEPFDYTTETNVTGLGGHVGMNLIMTLLPTNVCFANIEVVEVPSLEGTHTGYFADPWFSSIWYHTTNNHAGVWTNVDDDNLCGTDEASIGVCPPPFIPGEISWVIPNAWRPRGGGEQDSHLFVTFPQNFQITFDGTVTVSKLGNYVTRTTNDVITLNGVIVQ